MPIITSKRIIGSRTLYFTLSFKLFQVVLCGSFVKGEKNYAEEKR